MLWHLYGSINEVWFCMWQFVTHSKTSLGLRLGIHWDTTTSNYPQLCSSEGHPSHTPPTHGCPPVQQEWHSSCTAPLCGATQQGHWGGRIQYITYIKMAIMCSWHISYIHAYTQYHRNNLLVPNVLKLFLEVFKFLHAKHTANYKQTWHNLPVKLGLHFLHKVCGLTLVVSTTLPPWTTML